MPHCVHNHFKKEASFCLNCDSTLYDDSRNCCKKKGVLPHKNGNFFVLLCAEHKRTSLLLYCRRLGDDAIKFRLLPGAVF